MKGAPEPSILIIFHFHFGFRATEILLHYGVTTLNKLKKNNFLKC